MNRSTPGLPVHHQLLEFTQTHVHRVSNAFHYGQAIALLTVQSHPWCLIPGLNLILEILLQLSGKLKGYLVKLSLSERLLYNGNLNFQYLFVYFQCKQIHSLEMCPVCFKSSCRPRNETPTLQSGLNLYVFNTCFLQLLYFISLAQQPTGQVAKHYDSETIQWAGSGRDNLYFDLFTAAKTLFWGTSLSTQNPFCPWVCSF